MREPEYVEIGFADRIDPLLEPLWHQKTELREIPGHRDAERRHDIGDRDSLRDRRQNESRYSLRPAQRAPGAEYEQQLPEKRIESPETVRIGGDMEIIPAGQHVQRDRESQSD